MDKKDNTVDQNLLDALKDLYATTNDANNFVSPKDSDTKNEDSGVVDTPELTEFVIKSLNDISVTNRVGRGDVGGAFSSYILDALSPTNKYKPSKAQVSRSGSQHSTLQSKYDFNYFGGLKRIKK